MARKKLWIKGAIKRPGILRAKAKAMGIGTMALARRWKGKAGVWGRRARLALTLHGLSKRRGGRRATRTRARRR